MIWVLALTASVAAAQETSPSREAPAVPSFERFAEADPAEGGRLLLGELGCVSCHPSDGSDFLPVRRGPILAGAGRKFRSEWLRAWLESPSRVKPGTPMPAAVREPAEIDPLVHYLLSLGSEPPAAEAAGTPAKARDIYEQTGCAACHGPLEGKDLAGPFVPLGDLRSKYLSAGALARFLQDPLRARPSGRMPRLNLSAAEAGALALYFVGGRPRDPDDPGGTRPGVAFEYFEGSWGKLPDFDALKPAASGVSAGFDLKPLRRQDHVGLRFRGYVEVPRDGLYTFTTTSDDGSRLRIGSAVVVDNDGTHPAVEAAGTIALRKGKHALTVEWFEAGGEESLAVHWEGPGIAKEPIPPSALSHVPPSGLGPVREKPPEEGIRPDPALARRGREIFLRRCASCHEAEPGDRPVRAQPLASLRGKSGGCLSERPPGAAPVYPLSPRQRAAIRAALDTPAAAGPREEERRVDRMLAAFNCYACHARNGKGGPLEAVQSLFRVTDPTIGDEGRLPPHLTGVGAKLRREWLREVLATGAKVRPYMLARMPAFGLENIGALVEDFEKADLRGPESPAPPRDENLAKAGRQLAGTKGLSCVSCHLWNGQKSLGVPGMDLTVMARRLRRDWFHRYLLDPNSLRPGTRMPTFWPEGRSVLKTVLGGDAALQIEALWQYLADGPKARPPLGIGPQPILLVPQDEAIIYRNFIQGAGPRAIAVGYPEHAHLAFDANHMRLALLWRGDFIDASKHWVDRGPGFQSPAGDDVVALADGPPFAELRDPVREPWPAPPKYAWEKAPGYRFLGYELDSRRRPAFLYSYGSVRIRDFPEAVADEKRPWIRRTLVLEAEDPPANLWYRPLAARSLQRAPDGSFRTPEGLSVRLVKPEGAEPVVFTSGAGTELRIPVRFSGSKAIVVEHYGW